jgi:hypothetical protein
MSNKTSGSSSTKLNTESILKKEGILNNDEEFETVYLAEDEIEHFMERYLAENPGAEIETRYIKPPPVQVVQDIHVRWLRPPTPEMPPIIIREVGVQQREPPPLRIVEKPKNVKEPEPIIIRERPPPPPIEEPTIAYVQNVIKIENKPANLQQSGSKSRNSNKTSTISQEIPVEYVSSKNLPDYIAGEQTTMFEIETNLSGPGGERGGAAADLRSTTSSNDKELQEYEDRLKRRLSESTLKKNSTKIAQVNQPHVPSTATFSAIEEQRIFHLNNDRLESFNEKEEENRSQLFTTSEELRTTSNSSSRLRPSLPSVSTTHHDRLMNGANQKTTSSVITNVTRNTGLSSSTIHKAKSDTSTYKNIKFKKITDPEELHRFNAIFENPNTPFIKSKTDGDKIMSSFEITDSFKSNNSNINNKSTNSMRTNSISNYSNDNKVTSSNVHNDNIHINNNSTNNKNNINRVETNSNIQNSTRLSPSSFNANILNNSTLNIPAPATSTSTENGNYHTKSKEEFLVSINYILDT